MNLILEAYTWNDVVKPRKIIEELKEEANEVSDYDRLMMLFEFHATTCNACNLKICNEHIVYNNEIVALLETNQIAYSLHKVTKILVKNKCIKDCLMNKRCIRCISIIQN